MDCRALAKWPDEPKSKNLDRDKTTSATGYPNKGESGLLRFSDDCFELGIPRLDDTNIKLYPCRSLMGLCHQRHNHTLHSPHPHEYFASVGMHAPVLLRQ